jgi:hypothetical protein
MQLSVLMRIETRKPILRNELQTILGLKNKNTLNQYISVLLKFNIIKSFQNGIYYIPEKEERFKKLQPSLIDIINVKYCNNYSGFRTGAALLNKYKFTTQVSSHYEIISSNVSKKTRNIKVLRNKVSVSYGKMKINKENYYYLIYAEILKNIKYSDYSREKNVQLLYELMCDLKLDKELLKEILSKYKSNRLKYMHNLFREILDYETA